MPFLFKLSRRVARVRTPVVLLATAALVGACDSTDRGLSDPTLTRPSFATASGLPAGVTDLAVAATTDTSVTLTFTEVDDGTSGPASYDIRVAPTPLVWGATAPTVKRGTCATPVAGSAIGAQRTCTVLGLITGTAYSFQLVSFRGTLLVNAVFGPLSNVATGTARTLAPPVTTAPGTVTDLNVAGTTDTVMTLSFTEVTDGSGHPASYDIRVVPGSTLSWGASAPSVVRGSCATALAGSAIGAKRTCTVQGLTVATTYTFQLAAFRGTLKVDAVFGPLSNIATGTTATRLVPVTPLGTVSDLKVAGATDTAVTLSFTEVSDGSGRPATYDVRYVSGSTLSWGASTPSVSRGSCANPLTGTSIGAKRSCTVLGLTPGTTYSFELVAYRGTLNLNAVFGGLSNITTGATTGASSGGGTGGGIPGGGTVLLQENFQDGGSSGRGWYDDGNLPVTTAQHMAGAASALELHFLAGAHGATFGGAARHLFTPTSTLYVSYWVKYSSNWVGSGSHDHPHEFYVLSNQDREYAPLADDWLTTYIETNFVGGAGTPRVTLQDNLAINRNMGTTPLNLIGLTENRSVGGCNGVVETSLFSECYGSGTYNDKQFNRVGPAVFQAQSGTGYKGNWNHVEVYLQMNSIVGGVGVPNGIVQYWFNGTPVIDRHDVLFRTGARANLAFAQFIIGPYIGGGGSSVDQTMWVDNLTLATSRP